MATNTNLYAERVYSEHPIALWMLGEKVDYINKISPYAQDFMNNRWFITNGVKSLNTTTFYDTPIPEGAISEVGVSSIPSVTTDISIISNDSVATDTLDLSAGTFSIAGHIRINSSLINSISFGYTYIDTENNNAAGEVLVTKSLGLSLSGQWVYFSHTFDTPPLNKTALKMKMVVNVSASGAIDDYTFYLNGLSFGQWSEEFSKTSIGNWYPEFSPADLLPIQSIPALQYGGSGKNGYYARFGYTKLYATNSGIPIVYGSSNVTKLYPNPSGPSLMFPGYGFLHESGKYNEYTVEMWIKANADTTTARRIFGPLNSTDGLYIDGAFLTLKIGTSHASHYIGEWYRPMLIDIRYVKNNASVVLNGETIIDLPLIEDNLVFPSGLGDEFTLSEDFLGFYAYNDINPIEIDSFAIYSYPVPNEVAKRRFVWGQAIVAPEQTNSSLNAITAYNDYTYSNYAVNYNYPDQASWTQANFNNLNANSRSLEVPDYSLPKIELGTKSLSTWYSDMQTSIKPTSTRTNMITNPSGEVNSTNFGGANLSLATSTTFSRIRTKSVKATINTLSSAQYIDNVAGADLYPVTAGLSYTASVYVYIPETNTADTAFTLQMHPNNGVSYGVSYESGPVTLTRGQWKRLSVTFTPTTVNSLPVTKVLFRVLSSASLAVGQVFYIDGLLLEQTPILNSYFDGSYHEYSSSYSPVTAWTGTTNASTSTVTYLSNLDDILGHKYFTFKPNSSWSGQLCHFYFTNFKAITDTVNSFFGIFESESASTPQTLFRITNKQNNDYIQAVLSGLTITYTSNLSGLITTIGTKTITANTKFAAGLNIPELCAGSIDSINQFFTNESSLSLYVGGTPDDTFIGRIYSFNFNSEYNDKKLEILYDAKGIFNVDLTSANTLFDHTASYKLELFDKYNSYFADISVSSYWEDYMPLSYFARYVTDYAEDVYYDLDYLQFNLDFPEPREVLSTVSLNSWTYADLSTEYNDPYPLTYAELSNEFYTEYGDYEDLKNDDHVYYYYDTSNNEVKAYVSFQSTASGANKSLVEYADANKKTIAIDGTIDTDLITGNWEDLVYEVVDGTVIFPPTLTSTGDTVDFNDYAIVYHLDINVKGILHKKLKIRNLQIASEVLERSKFTEIGSKFAVQLNPYTKTGIYYDFKAKNPITTYKGSTPHLYLNRHSGWGVKKGSDLFTERGIAIPVNTQLSNAFNIAAIQMWIKFSSINVPFGETKLMTVTSNNGIYDFYFVGDISQKRGSVYCKNRLTNAILTNIQYYINGNIVGTPYIYNEEWCAFGIEFGDVLDFSSTSGSISLNGPFTYNNISSYLTTNLDQVQNIIKRTWQTVKDAGVWNVSVGTKPWLNSTWNNMLVISSSNQGVIDLVDVYSKYTGSNRIVIDDEISGLRFSQDLMKNYQAISWSSSVKTPV